MEAAVLAYISEQEGDNRKVMEYLHHLLMASPQVTCKIRYKIPFYYRKSWFCYLNPVKGGGVELAFTRGNELPNSAGLLEARGRKQVWGVVFRHPRDIPEEALHETLMEALELDETIKYQSKRKQP